MDKLRLAKNISELEVKKLKKVFDSFDTDKSGEITSKEFIATLKKEKTLSAVTKDFFESLDADKDGKITFAELIQHFYPKTAKGEILMLIERVCPRRKVLQREEKRPLSRKEKDDLTNIFKLYDEDSSGCISIDELTKALKVSGMSKDDIDKMFEVYDADGNALLSCDEFIELLRDVYSDVPNTNNI